jgi:hypothetical protein
MVEPESKNQICLILSLLASTSCYSQCGPQTGSNPIAWELVRSSNLRLCAKPIESESLF